MFRTLTRKADNNNTELSSSTNSMPCLQKTSPKDFDASSRTQDLSFLSLDSEEESDDNNSLNNDDECGQPSCVLLSDYESDSLEDISYERKDSIETTASSDEDQCPSVELSSTTDCSSTSSSTGGGGARRSVRFAGVHIRKYGVCVGDNPAVSLGVPVSLSWQVVSEETCSMENYDVFHPHQGLGEEELRLSSTERDAMVRSAGFSTEAIRSSVREVNTVKMERERTLDTLKNSDAQYRMEKLRKSVWNATVRRRSKKMERALLQQMLQKDAQQQQQHVVQRCLIPSC